MKKVLIIKTSLRNNSNSDILAEEFAKGAKDSGNDVEVISLKDKKIRFCIGCMTCQNTKRCIFNDDAIEIADKMCEADTIVWATPVYYYSISGQMKTLIDRANSLYVREKKFKEVYLLATAAEDESYTPEGAIKAVQGWVDCFEGVKFKDTLFIGGVSNPNDIINHPKLKEAYNLGKTI